ncbi:MAG: metabolite traffic protein EboE [Planctomycetota bacterium]
MRDALGPRPPGTFPGIPPGSILGYCTNVHAGATFGQVKANLERYALPVKAEVSPERPMGVGLWLSADAMQEVIEQDLAPGFRDWLGERGLLPYTFNGFPFDDFHQPVVKDKVYLPHWADGDRYAYTLGLASILAELLPDGGEGSISTLPIGWPASFCDSPDAYATQARGAADQLLKLVHTLARIELDTGKHLHIDLEPEPGCVLESAAGVVEFFERYLLGGPDDVSVLGYLRVCHDVCHSAVMFEEQAEALATYRQSGIKVGKAQLSSAVRVPFGEMDADTRGDAWQQLGSFCEDRYLHQTSIRTDDGRVNSYVDLPQAMADHDNAPEDGEWRVHFHVPIHLDTFDSIQTTRHEIGNYLNAIQPGDETNHFEVETYAWDVLPEPLRVDDLAAGIAAELRSVITGYSR